MLLTRIVEDLKVISKGMDFGGYVYSSTARLKLTGIYAGILLGIAGAYTAAIHKLESSFPQIRAAIAQYDLNAAQTFDTIIDLEFSIRVAVYHIIGIFRDTLSASITYLQHHPVIAVIFGLMIFYMINNRIKDQTDW